MGIGERMRIPSGVLDTTPGLQHSGRAIHRSAGMVVPMADPALSALRHLLFYLMRNHLKPVSGRGWNIGKKRYRTFGWSVTGCGPIAPVAEPLEPGTPGRTLDEPHTQESR